MYLIKPVVHIKSFKYIKVVILKIFFTAIISFFLSLNSILCRPAPLLPLHAHTKLELKHLYNA